jgi:hypothetical protein
MKTLRFLKTPKVLILQAVVILFVTSLALGSQDPSSGPALGDTINLSSFQGRDGRSLAEIIKGHSLAMVVLVNPSCTTCTATKDTMRNLRERVADPGIPYYVLMIPDSSETQKYFSYADSLNLKADAFIWVAKDVKAPSSLALIPAPSHLLITNEGLVVNKWIGTTPDSR